MESISSHTGGEAASPVQDHDVLDLLSESEEVKPAESPLSFQSSKKRKRGVHAQDEGVSAEDTDTTEDEVAREDLVQKSRKRRPHKCIAAVKIPSLIYPESSYQNYEQSTDLFAERDVLREALVGKRISLHQRITLSYTRNINASPRMLKFRLGKRILFLLILRISASIVPTKLGWSRSLEPSRKCRTLTR